MTTQQELITNTDTSITSAKNEKLPLESQNGSTDEVVNDSENGTVQQNTAKKQELTPIGNISEGFIPVQTMSPSKKSDSSAEGTALSDDLDFSVELIPSISQEGLNTGFDVDLGFLDEDGFQYEGDLIEVDNTKKLNVPRVNDDNQPPVGLNKSDTLNDFSDSCELDISEDINGFDKRLNNIDSDIALQNTSNSLNELHDYQDSANQQESFITTSHNTEQIQEIISDDFLSQLDEITQSTIIDKPLTDDEQHVSGESEVGHKHDTMNDSATLSKVSTPSNNTINSSMPTDDSEPTETGVASKPVSIYSQNGIVRRPTDASDDVFHDVLSSLQEPTKTDNQEQVESSLKPSTVSKSKQTVSTPQQKNKLRDKDPTTFDRFLSGLFSGVLFGFGGVLIDLVVNTVRAISDIGSGDILWLFAPFLAILGFIIGFIRSTDEDYVAGVNTKDHSVYTESGGIVKLIITTVSICAIIWLVVLMMS